MDRGKSAGSSRFFPMICPSPPEFSRKFRCFCRLRRPISGQTLPRGDPNGPKTSRPAHLRRPPPGPGIAFVPGLQQRQHQKIPSAQRRNGCPRGRQLRRGEYAVSRSSPVGAIQESPAHAEKKDQPQVPTSLRGAKRRGNPFSFRPQRGRAVLCTAGDADCHGPDGPRNDVEIWGLVLLICCGNYGNTAGDS